MLVMGHVLRKGIERLADQGKVGDRAFVKRYMTQLGWRWWKKHRDCPKDRVITTIKVLMEEFCPDA